MQSVTPTKEHRRKPKPIELQYMHEVDKRSKREIAEIVGYSYSTIRKWFRDYDIESSPSVAGLATPPERPTPPPVEELRRLLAAGISYRQLARRYEVDPKTVRRWAADIGATSARAKRRSKSSPSKPKRNAAPPAAELRRLYHDEQLTMPQIAERYDEQPQSVSRWLAAAGIEARPRGKASHEAQLAEAPAEHVPELAPFPTPGKRGSRKAVRAWLRLTSTEQKIVGRQVDDFLLWVAGKREEREG